MPCRSAPSFTSSRLLCRGLRHLQHPGNSSAGARQGMRDGRWRDTIGCGLCHASPRITRRQRPRERRRAGVACRRDEPSASQLHDTHIPSGLTSDSWRRVARSRGRKPRCKRGRGTGVFTRCLSRERVQLSYAAQGANAGTRPSWPCPWRTMPPEWRNQIGKDVLTVVRRASRPRILTQDTIGLGQAHCYNRTSQARASASQTRFRRRDIHTWPRIDDALSRCYGCMQKGSNSSQTRKCSC